MATLAAPGVSATARSRTDVTDHDLVEAVRAGDDHAFERLYERYHRRIAAYIFGMVRDHGRAEDLTQEVFVSALRRMRQTDREIHFKPWIYEIAKNACIDAFRRSRRAEEVSFEAEHDAGGADAARLVTTTGAPDAAVARKQQLDHLWGAFDGLSDAHHQILVMRELEGLSYAEIGERLGLSRASVESTLFRARRRLTEEFEELQTGAACRRAQDIIDGAGAAGLGRRDQRRLGRHIARCAPCRREAFMAGLDAAAMARLPVRAKVGAKVGALLPLPAFLRRRWSGGGAEGAAHHAAQWSATAATYGDASAGWIKAVAAAAAVALAGAGAGTVVTGHGGGDRAVRHAEPAPVAPTGSAGGPARAAVTGGPSGTAGRRAAARSHAGAAERRSHGAARGGDGAWSPERGAAGRAPGGGGAASGATGGGAGTAVQRVAGNVSSQVGSHQPLVAPDAGALTQPTSGTAPTSAGDAVQQATEQVGTAVGGSVGQAVQDTGAAVGSAVDQVTTTASDTVQGTVGTVETTAQGATRIVQHVAETAGTAAGDAAGTITGGALGGR